MVFNTANTNNEEIGSIITELNLDSISFEMDKPAETEKPAEPDTGTPSEVKDVLKEVQEAPLEERLMDLGKAPHEPKTIVPDETTPLENETTPPTETTLSTETETASPDSDTETPPQQDNTDVYASFAQAVFEEGVLADFNKEEFVELSKELGSPAKALIELNKRTIQHHVNSHINSYPEEIKKLAENYREGVPLDELIEVQSEGIRLSNISDEQVQQDPVIRKQLIIEDLKARGFTEEEAGEEYTLYVESAVDDKKALKARERMVQRQDQIIKTKAEKAQEARENRLKAIEDSRKTLKEKVDVATEFIPGIEVNNRDKALVFNALTKPVGRDAKGNEVNEIMKSRAKNPIHFDTMVAYLYTKGVFDVDDKGNPAPKTSDLFKGKKSETITDLEKQMNSFGQQFREQGSSVTVGDEPSAGGDHVIKQLNFQ